jgi:glycosyltransferase involved in cell wall biosynthesis
LLSARCLRRPSALVIGGYDLANLPSIGYGHQRGGLKKWVSRATMALANALITNSRYSEREGKQNAGLGDRPVRVIYHGLPDPFAERMSGLGPATREPLAISVGNVDRANLQRKGLEPFVRAAAHLPQVKFVVAGAWKDDAIERLRSLAGPNVEFTGWVDDQTLQQLYLRASVYVQASQHEGFGMAVAEAMLAGCIPVVSRDGALPEVAGDCGIYSAVDPKSLALAIQQAMTLKDDSRVQARQRVLAQFSLSKRGALLGEVISQLVPGNSRPRNSNVARAASAERCS